MRITEAVAILADEYPRYSKNKLKGCLRIEMNKGADVDIALAHAREAIEWGSLQPSTRRTNSHPASSLPKHLRG